MWVTDEKLSSLLAHHQTTVANTYLPESVREASQFYVALLAELAEYRKRERKVVV
jgi:hypothetical protein